MKKRTALALSQIKDPGRYAVGDGCYLQITGASGRSWIFRYRDRMDGKGRHMGLGPCELLTLAEARNKAREQRKLLLDNIDPLDHKKQQRQKARLDAARGVSFKDCAEKYITAHECSWRNEEHCRQWKATLKTYAYPVLGELPVADIDTGLVLKALEAEVSDKPGARRPFWTSKPETASRVRNRIELILDWATAREYRKGDNPARWRGHLDKVLPKLSKIRTIKHHPALPYAELPGFMAELRREEGVPARALELIILTAVRRGEAIGARWPEIDLSERVWIIPASRTKTKKEHRVPLSDRSLEILKALPRDGEFVFPGRTGRPINGKVLQQETIQRLRKGITVHGFRSTFRDWTSERTGYPREVAEAALAHTLESKVEKAYRRGDLFEKRRKLMADWAKCCASEQDDGEDVLPPRRMGYD